jgi:hypothetical protein
MNTMEHSSFILLHVVCTIPPTSLKHLADILVEEWIKIPLETIQVLYECIPRWIEAVLKVNGSPTPY